MSDRWVQVEAVLRQALSRPPADRLAFVDAACEGHPEVRDEVASLLAHERDAEAFLQAPARAAAPSLRPGDRLGNYRIEQRIGSGGMGEVYRARDTVLDRDVAVKVLAAPLALDDAAVSRLAREARMLATLSHPYIAAIHGVEEQEGMRAIVMELLDGETLAARMSRAPLPLSESVRIASQLADGLAAAHEKGIVHRDVKPANVQITAAGNVKVLDFGLAKAPAAPTRLTALTTREGTVMGTPGYMSPEQTRGEPVDRQTDVWAFGCVLFEMLTGARAFEGATASDTLAAVLEREPRWGLLARETPGPIVDLLRHCLEKDRARRLRDLHDVRILLESGARQQSKPDPWSGRRVLPRQSVAWAAVVVLGVALLTLLLRWGRHVEPPVIRYEFRAPEGQSLANVPALAPDGSQVVFATEDASRVNHLWLRRFAADDPVILNGTEEAVFPFWSPDGRAIAFFAGGKLRRIPIDGGPPVDIADAPTPRGGVWDPKAGILFAAEAGAGLMQIATPGAAPLPFTTLRSHEKSHRIPFVAGSAFGYFAIADDPNDSGVWLAPLSAPASATRILRSSDAAAYADGYLFFVRDDTLVAQRLDVERRSLIGDPIAIADGVATSGSGLTAIPALSATGGGTLVARRWRSPVTELRWISRAGGAVQPVGIPPAAVTNPELSPDGSRLAYQVGDRLAGELWVFDLTRRTAMRAAARTPGVLQPLWSPDGSRLIVSSPQGIGGNTNLYALPASGGSLDPLVRAQAGLSPIGWAAGRLLFAQADAPPPAVIKVLDDGEAPRTYFDPHSNLATARVAPDGRAIAYTTLQSGRPEVFLVGYPSPGPPVQVSTGGGSQPRWRGDGRELFYLAPDGKLMAVPVERQGGGWRLGVPIALLSLRTSTLTTLPQYRYDVTRDGTHFVVAAELQPAVDSMLVIRNWTGPVL